jgi:trk system potassium uptake protein TrkA
MRAIIVGCGRVGAGLAERFARAGHDVTILDLNTDAFNRLPADFPGSAVRGDGTDEDVLRRAGAEGADYFFALTEGDNRNVLAAQLATESLGVIQVVAKVNDPVRAQAYTTLGLNTICRTTILVDALSQFAGLPAEEGAAGVMPAAAEHHRGEQRMTGLPDGERPGGDRAGDVDRLLPASKTGPGPTEV